MNLQRIQEISAELVKLDNTITQLGEIAMSTDVTPDVVSVLCIQQSKKVKAESLETAPMPTIVLPQHLIANPAAAGSWLRAVMAEDQRRLKAGKIPDQLEELHHVHLDLDQGTIFKILNTIKENSEKQRDTLKKQLTKLLKESV